jgi:hypothetical protein
MNKERNYQPVLVVLVLIVIGWRPGACLRTGRTGGRNAGRRRTRSGGQWGRRCRKGRRTGDRTKTAQDETSHGQGCRGLRPRATAPTSQETSDVESNERQIPGLFQLPDGRDYGKAYALEGGTYAQYAAAVAELSAGLAKVAGETESLYTTLKNVLHFFRVLGKE